MDLVSKQQAAEFSSGQINVYDVWYGRYDYSRSFWVVMERLQNPGCRASANEGEGERVCT